MGTNGNGNEEAADTQVLIDLGRSPLTREAYAFLNDPADDGYAFMDNGRAPKEPLCAVARRHNRQLTVDDLKELGFGFEGDDLVACPTCSEGRKFRRRLWPFIDANTGMVQMDEYRTGAKLMSGNYLVLIADETTPPKVIAFCTPCQNEWRGKIPTENGGFMRRPKLLPLMCQVSAEAFALFLTDRKAQAEQSDKARNQRAFDLFGRPSRASASPAKRS